MTPGEAKVIRKRHWHPLPKSTDPHPLDGYTVGEFVKRCRSGWFTRPPTAPKDPVLAAAKLLNKYEELDHA